jgi:predicted DNA-binding transcriptional regulator AlpA
MAKVVKALTDLEVAAHIAAIGCDGHLRSLWKALAVEFGRRRGWIWTPRKWFCETRIGAHKPAYEYRMNDYGRNLLDHSYCDFTPDGKPAAIVCHPYGKPDYERFAADAGLAFELPTDFPSWHLPGESTLVAYTRSPNPSPWICMPEIGQLTSLSPMAIHRLVGFPKENGCSQHRICWPRGAVLRWIAENAEAVQASLAKAAAAKSRRLAWLTN